MYIQVESEELSKKRSNHVQRKIDSRKEAAKVEPALEDQFATGRLYGMYNFLQSVYIHKHKSNLFLIIYFSAIISSRPGQSGRADGYILEGKELEFYVRKIKSKK